MTVNTNRVVKSVDVFKDQLVSLLKVLYPEPVSMCTLIGRDEATRTIAALRGLHVPEKLIMVCSVIFRFFRCFREI